MTSQMNVDIKNCDKTYEGHEKGGSKMQFL